MSSGRTQSITLLTVLGHLVSVLVTVKQVSLIFYTKLRSTYILESHSWNY